MAIDTSHWLVVEWTAELFRGVVLKNTVEELATRLGARNAAARHAQWGFMFCRVAHPHQCPLRASCLRLKAAAWDKGVPRMYVRPVVVKEREGKKREGEQKEKEEEEEPATGVSSSATSVPRCDHTTTRSPTKRPRSNNNDDGRSKTNSSQ